MDLRSAAFTGTGLVMIGIGACDVFGQSLLTDDGWGVPMAVRGDELYVGGSFSVACGKASGNLAKVFLKGALHLEKTGNQDTAFFRGMSAGGYHVDRTTDFITWETLAARYAGETGCIDFTDEAAPEVKAFYRALPVEISTDGNPLP